LYFDQKNDKITKPTRKECDYQWLDTAIGLMGKHGLLHTAALPAAIFPAIL